MCESDQDVASTACSFSWKIINSNVTTEATTKCKQQLVRREKHSIGARYPMNRSLSP